jgi:hypothetical protein
MLPPFVRYIISYTVVLRSNVQANVTMPHVLASESAATLRLVQVLIAKTPRKNVNAPQRVNQYSTLVVQDDKSREIRRMVAVEHIPGSRAKQT